MSDLQIEFDSHDSAIEAALLVNTHTDSRYVATYLREYDKDLVVHHNLIFRGRGYGKCPVCSTPNTECLECGAHYPDPDDLATITETIVDGEPTKLISARYAVINDARPSEVAAYLPLKYRVLGTAPWTDEYGDTYQAVYIGGFDRAGWTMDAYIIPRLSSGNLLATEISLTDIPRDVPAFRS